MRNVFLIFYFVFKNLNIRVKQNHNLYLFFLIIAGGRGKFLKENKKFDCLSSFIKNYCSVKILFW